MRRLACSGLIGFLLVSVSSVLAQGADDNAVSSAADGFGTHVGYETVGLWSEDFVRGLNPQSAGNTRIEGMYFDMQGWITGRLITGSNIHIGLSSQGYPFPAPSGIVDYSLRVPRDETVLHVVAGNFSAGGYHVDLDGSAVVVKDRLSIGGGFGIVPRRQNDVGFGAERKMWAGAFLARWTPSDSVEVIPFYGHSAVKAERGDIILLPANGVAPERLPRDRYFAPEWTGGYDYTDLAGTLVNAKLGGGWTLKTGGFFSRIGSRESTYNLYIMAGTPTEARHEVIANPASYYRSFSGEARLTKNFSSGAVKHELSLVARARSVRGLFGGSDSYDAGIVSLLEDSTLLRPDFHFPDQSRDKVRQQSIGAVWDARWAGIAELNVGLQKASLKKTVTAPDLEPEQANDSPWLYNGSLAIFASKRLTLYGSYTRSLEQNDVAPQNAVNRGEVLPAIRTEQKDAGFRYEIAPKLNFIAGVYDARRPYFSVNRDSVFTGLGTVRFRGVELSLSGEAAPGLNIVTGMALMRSRVSTDPDIAEPVGKVPPGLADISTQIYADYRLPFAPAWSVDLGFGYIGKRPVDTANTLWTDDRVSSSLGARYQFKIGHAPATLRFRLDNVLNDYGWYVTPGGALLPTVPRGFSFTLSADL